LPVEEGAAVDADDADEIRARNGDEQARDDPKLDLTVRVQTAPVRGCHRKDDENGVLLGHAAQSMRRLVRGLGPHVARMAKRNCHVMRS
jgi:hypothetical protein